MNKQIAPVKDLAKRADYFARSRLSDNTKKAYQTDWKQFLIFCRDHDLEELPADVETVCLYLADLADSGSAVSTIVRRITSITAIHEASGHQSPAKSDKVSHVLQGIKKRCGRPVEQSKALSWPDLQKLVAQCDQMMFGLRDAALLMLGWTSALRRSELVSLDVGDIDFVDEGILVNLKRSKTDQEGRGRILAIPSAAEGICPVETVYRWMRRQNENGLPPHAPLFPSIGCHGRNKWWWTTGRRLEGRIVSKVVKHYAKLCGMPTERISAHSLRRGLASAAGAAGVPERVIARHTGHNSMAVLRGYIEAGLIWEENPLIVIYPSRSSRPLPSSD